MGRVLLPCPERPTIASVESPTYVIDVITPMFGGSAEKRKVDPDHPVRVSEIRGSLRFWWRATRGAACLDLDELRAEEGKIWGTTEERSLVGIELDTNPGQACALDGLPRYALFPFQEDQ